MRGLGGVKRERSGITGGGDVKGACVCVCVCCKCSKAIDRETYTYYSKTIVHLIIYMCVRVCYPAILENVIVVVSIKVFQLG